MKKITIIALSLLGSATSAWSTPVEDMVKQGFACDSGSRGEVVCSKDGAPTKICNAEGNCFRIIRIDAAAADTGVKTGSLRGPAYANTEY